MTTYGRTARTLSIFCAAAWMVWASGEAGAQAARSSNVASELATLMTERQLDSFAAQDPHAPNRFLATMLIPNVQMLVVAADYANPGELQTQLAQKNYRDVYAALHQPVTAASRFFLIDLACDGLHGGGGDAVDVLYEKGVSQTLFNGDWKQQGLSEATYNKRLQETEARYTRVLTLLRDALKASASGTQAQKIVPYVGDY
jgi:hypothetical protein